MTEATASEHLQSIPGVGPGIERALLELGYSRVGDLRDADPESMYQALCRIRGAHVDRCVLYVFRCAVYYASHTAHEPERLKWWHWKDPGQPCAK
ncbi:MAG: Pathogenicity locus [Gammaproteobacteria bacterium]|nr:MAG: Pathogenicity locus [Gammaproteobacteria bacterium]